VDCEGGGIFSRQESRQAARISRERLLKLRAPDEGAEGVQDSTADGGRCFHGDDDRGWCREAQRRGDEVLLRLGSDFALNLRHDAAGLCAGAEVCALHGVRAGRGLRDGRRWEL